MSMSLSTEEGADSDCSEHDRSELMLRSDFENTLSTGGDRPRSELLEQLRKIPSECSSAVGFTAVGRESAYASGDCGHRKSMLETEVGGVVRLVKGPPFN
eukprot:1147717_1